MRWKKASLRPLNSALHDAIVFKVGRLIEPAVELPAGYKDKHMRQEERDPINGVPFRVVFI